MAITLWSLQGDPHMDRRMQWALRRLQSLEERVSHMETAAGNYSGEPSLPSVTCEMLNGQLRSRVIQSFRDSHTTTAGFLSSCSCDDESTSNWLVCPQQLSVMLRFYSVRGTLVSLLCCSLCHACKRHPANQNVLYLYPCTACCTG